MWRADIDDGAMANFGDFRGGATVRNLTEPEFGDEPGQLALQRQARAGVAFFSVPNGFNRGLIVAADADLLTVSTAVGDVRHVAGDTVLWLLNGRLGLRGGASANTVGDWRPAGSVGASVGLTRVFYINASGTMGRDETVEGWSTSVRVAF